MRRVTRRVSLALVRPPACRTASTGGWTYYDILDSVWNRQWFGATDGLSVIPDTSPVTAALVSCQQILGVDPALALVLLGGLCRLATLYFSLSGERAAERMQLATRRLLTPHAAFQRVYYREGSSALDIQLAATALKGERRRVFREERTSNARCLSALLGSPIVMLGLWQTAALCEDPLLEFGTASFVWCPALALADPSGALPVACCGLTLLNFELSMRRELRTGWMANVVWAARLGCLCVVPAVVHFRAGVCLYFVGMSLVGLLQPLLLRCDGFRRWFAFPDRAALAAARLTRQDDALHTRMEVQFPYLAHLLSPESEENASLFKNTASTGIAREHTQTMQTHNKPSSSQHAQQQQQQQQQRSAGVVSRKGTNFASGGWKAARAEFREADFIPELDDSGNGGADHRKRR